VEKRQDVMQAFGDFLRQQRSLAKMSLRHLAKLSGVSDSYLSQVERGLYRPSAEVLHALADALNLPPATVYERYGMFDEDQAPPQVDVEEAIRLDPRLREPQKEALLHMYRTLVAEQPPSDRPSGN
jgi:transcriptional regulator with XRE-family HTH domain